MPETAQISPQRILVVQPSWVGDAVMATPALRAIRVLYPSAHISYLLRRYVKPIYSGMPWADKLVTYRTGRTKAKAGKGTFDLAGRLRSGKFDLAILLPNSFKSALVCKMAGIDRIVGYERDGRGFLLSDKLLPVKERGEMLVAGIFREAGGSVDRRARRDSVDQRRAEGTCDCRRDHPSDDACGRRSRSGGIDTRCAQGDHAPLRHHDNERHRPAPHR